MSEVQQRILVRETHTQESGRRFDGDHSVTFFNVTSHEVVREEEAFTDGLPAPQHVIVHVPERRDWSPPFGLDFLESA